MKILLAIVLVIVAVPVSCSTANRFNASRHTKVIIEAVEEYKSETGQLPSSLEALEAWMPSEEKLKTTHSSDVGLIWSISYTQESKDSYKVRFNHVHYGATYKNGKRESFKTNYFR